LRVIIIGAGEVGFYFAEWLAAERKEVVVLDTDEQALKDMTEHLDVQTLHGSGSNPRLLAEAGIKKADLLLAVTNSDEVNLIACFFANLIAPEMQKVALIRSDDFAAYQEQLAQDIFNISMVINPEVEVVRAIVRLIQAPEVEEINDFVGGQIKMVGKKLPPQSPLNNLRLLQLPEKIDRNRMIVAALIRDDQLLIPKGKDVLRAGDFVYYVCQQRDLQEIQTFFGGKSGSAKNILIVGGGRIGFRLAKQLDKKAYHVKLIEKDVQRCQEISARLHRIVVLQGFATDQAFLEQENVGSMDMVIAITNDEEMNILACLLAKRMGARKTICRVNKFAYIPLVHAIGIDHVVSPRRSAINSIFPYIRRGKIISTVSIKGKEAEVLEALALEDSEIIASPIKDLKFPKEALVLCLARGDEVIIPSGDTKVQPQDKVIILSSRAHISQVEQLLMSKRRSR
jgi:trk system potassium uptake protein TrkA